MHNNLYLILKEFLKKRPNCFSVETCLQLLPNQILLSRIMWNISRKNSTLDESPLYVPCDTSSPTHLIALCKLYIIILVGVT